ncbi:MAG: ATP-binding protein [Candidatus Omnitrophota bacterium]|nr:ATP-binding protein [Candidatus Omnitrophota bacterium]
MTKDKFFGRAICLDLLSKRITSFLEGYRQNIAVIGDELIGKTSLLFKFLSRFSDNRVVVVYLEVRPDSTEAFVKKFIGVMLYNFMINSGEPLKEDIDYLIGKSARYIPRTVEKIDLVLAAAIHKKSNVFTELLSLCDIFYRETGKHCLVIFDEFQNLEYLGIKNLFREWSKLLILQKDTMYIITSSQKFKARNILSKNLSLLFGNFEIMDVEPFDTKTSMQYVEERLAGTRINPGLMEFIVDFSGGYPLYLDIITSALLKSPDASLSEILESLLFDTSGILHQRFSGYIRHLTGANYSFDYLSILYLISCGRNKIKDIIHIMRKQKTELTLRINHLLEFDAITRSGDFLRLNDSVFGFWMRFVYQEKLSSLTHDAKNQLIKFRDNIEELIKDFIAASSKPVMERMVEVLRMFEDEIMQFEKKRIKLNHFREIKPLELRCRALKDGLLGRGQEGVWIMALKNDHLNEEDITEFARECKKYRHKTQRKIIITLQAIDDNTRLKAMEEKIWAWDVDNLNEVLRLFSKPGVVV